MSKRGRQGEGGGQPPKFRSEQLMKDALDLYFMGEGEEAPNKAGMLVHLDISRTTYGDYKAKFPDTIRWAESKIQTWWVKRLAGTSATGAIFYLKNAFAEDFRDKTETDITSAGKPITGMRIVDDDGTGIQNKKSKTEAGS